MTRAEQIREQAKHEDSDGYFGFISGAEWADNNPAWMEVVDLLHDHKLMREALEDILNCMLDYETKYFSQESCVIAANVSRADIALSKLKVK